jgi:phytoene synthase
MVPRARVCGRTPPSVGGDSVKASGLVSQLTRRSRSNFYYAFLTLPRPRRDALYAVYAFCRTVDDIADLGQERGIDVTTLRGELASWREEIARCYARDGRPEHPIAQRLAVAVRTYPIPREALTAIVDGVAMDLDGTIYETEDQLYPYCYRVASAVGLAALEIFGYTDPGARQYATSLGIALQLTNIIRDVGSDARAGRVYVPSEDLRRFGVTSADLRAGRVYVPRQDLTQFGVTPDDLRAGRYTDGFANLMAHQAARARRFYREARETFPRKDARSLIPAEIMGQIYWALLGRIEASRYRVLDERVTVPAPRKVAIALRCWTAARLGTVAAWRGMAA